MPQLRGILIIGHANYNILFLTISKGIPVNSLNSYIVTSPSGLFKCSLILSNFLPAVVL